MCTVSASARYVHRGGRDILLPFRQGLIVGRVQNRNIRTRQGNWTVNGVQKDTTQETKPDKNSVQNVWKANTGRRRGTTIGGHALRAGIQKPVLLHAKNVHLTPGQGTSEVGHTVSSSSPWVGPNTSTTPNPEDRASQSTGCRL